MRFAYVAAASGEVRILTLDAETSTSDCMGDPKTPLCAVETRLACSFHSRKDFCVAVDADYAGHPSVNPDSYVGIADRWYEVLKQEVIDEANVQFYQRGLNQPFLFLGDVAVWFRWTTCWPEDACIRESRDDPNRRYGEECSKTLCFKDRYPAVTIVREKGDRWVVVHYSLEFRVP